MSLKYGSLSGQDLSLLTQQSVLLCPADESPGQHFGPMGLYRETMTVQGQTLIGVSQQPGALFSPDRFTYIGEQDVEGWIEWAGGENPVPGVKVNWQTRNELDRDQCTTSVLSDNLDWSHECRRGFARIIAFRPLSTKPQGEDQGSNRKGDLPTEQAQAAVVADQTERWAKALYFTNGFYSDPTDWDDMAPNDAGIRQLHTDMARAAKEVWDRADTPAIAKGGAA